MEKLETSQMIALVGVLLVVCGLFLPWVTWKEYLNVPAGYTIGLKTVDGWILLVFALIAGYLSLEESGGLNSLLTIFFGSFVFFGFSLNMGDLVKFVSPDLFVFRFSQSFSTIVSTGVGLYMGSVGGLLVLLYGIFTIIRLPIPPSIFKPAKKITRKVVTGTAIVLVVVTISAGIYLAATTLAPIITSWTPPLPPPPENAAYRDPTLPPEVRAADLLSWMTLDEKIGQMTQVDHNIFQYLPTSDIAEYHLGSLFSGGGSCPYPNTPSNWARMYNEYQRYAVEDTRLGIPILYGIDAVHGHNNVYGAVIFPHNVGMGSTWNPNLVEESAHITAVEVGATGIDWTFSPCIDVAKDDRWGRTYESFSEDPYLVEVMGVSAIRGYQGTDLTLDDTILATGKHYMGSGGTTGGIDQGNCEAPMRIIREQHLEPFTGAIDAGVQTIMPSFCSVNGEKIHGREDLLTGVLKVEQGFNNFLVSDWAAIDQLSSYYRVAVATSINAGIDMVMVPYNYIRFQNTLRNLVNDNYVPMSRIDNAVYRILVAKFRLGLFEEPYVDEDLSSIVGSAAHREVARQAVRESIVLLKNDNILPIPKNIRTVYVAGINADDIGSQCGGWTISWQGGKGDITQGTSILEAIQNTVSAGTTVVFDEFARNIADPYDIGIVVVGETPYAEWLGDRDNLDLPAYQLEIIDRVVASGTPTVVIMVAGRPLTGIESKLPEWDAFLMAWLPGTEGQGVADVLFGDYNPSGRLSRSWPRTTDQEPINYDHRPDENYDPLFEFGYGLSYTTFTYSNLSVTPANPGSADNITVSVDVRNTGNRSGSETVQVYVSDAESTLSTPVKKLYRFEKIALNPNETKTVTFTIPVPELGFYTDGPEKVVEDGTFVVTVGELTASFAVG
jgi:beta-glucosidase